MRKVIIIILSLIFLSCSNSAKTNTVIDKEKFTHYVLFKLDIINQIALSKQYKDDEKLEKINNSLMQISNEMLGSNLYSYETIMSNYKVLQDILIVKIVDVRFTNFLKTSNFKLAKEAKEEAEIINNQTIKKSALMFIAKSYQLEREASKNKVLPSTLEEYKNSYKELHENLKKYVIVNFYYN